MSASLVLDPEFGFQSLDAHLASLGFVRDPSVRPVTADTIPDEPELAAWAREGRERLTYTFNPVVSLRALDLRGITGESAVRLSEHLPLLDLPAIGQLLIDQRPRRVLLGLLAARILGLRELALAIAPLQAHADATIQRAAASTLEVLQVPGGPGAREQAIAVLRVLSEQAIPVLAALVGPDGAKKVREMRPRDEDYPRVFVPEICDAVRDAYQRVWQTPPEPERLTAGELTLKVEAAPAGMLREENELSRHFPGGYLALAPYLRPDRIWFVWRYLRRGEHTGTRYDGVVLLDDRWVWFPKPYRIVGGLLMPRRETR